MSNAAPLQQFAEKKSAWRFLKIALLLRAPEPAFGHVLIRLANHANGEGVCWPSHQTLMEETGYTTPTTIVEALKHWKLAGVLTWKKGWGNAHDRRSNVYQFHEDAMLALKDESSTTTAPFDEQPLGTDEQPLARDEQPLAGVSTTTKPLSKVLGIERPSLKKVPALKGAAGPAQAEKNGRQDKTATQSHLEEQPISGHSSEQPLSGYSSIAHTVPTPTLAELFQKLSPDQQKVWYKRTHGETGPDAIAVAQEILTA